MSRSGEQLDQWIESLLDDCRGSNRLREVRAVRPVSATHIEIAGRRYVNFCSNNYLGLTFHSRLAAAAEAAVRACGTGSGSAALISGQTPAHAAAEEALAQWKQTEAAVLLPSGYQANQAAVQTLAAIEKKRKVGERQGGRGRVRFLVDKLVHASILDAVLGSGVAVRVFPHNNLNKLERLLADSQAFDLNVVATESIFSMDGDAADLAGLARLKEKYPFVLLLDEAHGSGVYGPAGAGYAHELNLQSLVDVSVVTLSKALGGIGGAICASRTFCQGVVNFGRAFIYTTSLPASAAATARAAIEVLRDEPERQARLRKLSLDVRRALAEAGIVAAAGDSPIVCAILGEETKVIAASELARSEGLLVGAIRPPTVAPGSSRLRMTLCCEHTDEEVSRLISVLKKIFARERASAQRRR